VTIVSDGAHNEVGNNAVNYI